MAEGIVNPSRAINDCDADGYKYLGVLEGDKIKHTILSGYFRDTWTKNLKV